MVLLWEMLSDLVRCEQGWWSKDSDGVWRFVVAEDRLSKGIKIREGEELLTARSKIIEELHIDEAVETIELTYQMPSWMDVDGSVKPVPITIRTDDDLDMFLAMKMDLRDLRLYVVPLPKGMNLELEDFRVVKPTHGFAMAETVRGEDYDRENGVGVYNGSTEIITLTQRVGEAGESSRAKDVKSPVLTNVSVNTGESGHGSSASVFPDSSSSTKQTSGDRVTKNLFPLFESEGMFP